jgi:hypothetical protein
VLPPVQLTFQAPAKLKMIKPLFSAIALSAAVMPSISLAGPTTDALASCVADNTTGKDRKDLAKWVFVAMSAHPEIKPLSKASDAVKESLDKNLANLATKLITESCRAEAQQAFSTEGQKSFEFAFHALGQLAMQELTTNPAVSASFSNYVKYLDRAKFEAAFSGK